ncbi:MAG: hypothetical protein M3081_21695 [Gemmatimonadota bacterium]|nr:hypothetical protein [Gemmatimonadota bacterium]
MHVAVGLLAVVLALAVRIPFAMFFYFLIVPLQTIQGRARRTAVEKLARRNKDAPGAPPFEVEPVTPDV